MKIATLEKIHELLKGEVEARRNAENILKKHTTGPWTTGKKSPPR